MADKDTFQWNGERISDLHTLEKRFHRYAALMAYYRCAMMEIETKFNVLNQEFSLRYDRNPIQDIRTRLKSPDSIFRPAYEDTVGSPVLFPSWAFPELKTLPQGKGGGTVIQNHPQEVIRVSASHPFELADADTPEMLELLKGLLPCSHGSQNW